MFGSCNNLPLISISQKPEICIKRDLKPIKNIWNMSNIHGIAFSINSNKQHHKTLRAKIDISAGLGCNASCNDNTTKVLDNDVILKTHFHITYQTRPILPYPCNERGFWIIRTYKTSRLIIYSTGTNNDREATTQGITEILKRNFMMQRTVNEDCMQREISWCRERSLQEANEIETISSPKTHTPSTLKSRLPPTWRTGFCGYSWAPTETWINKGFDRIGNIISKANKGS